MQRLARDVLHDDEEAAIGVADLEDLADEGMVERGGGERLAAKSARVPSSLPTAPPAGP